MTGPEEQIAQYLRGKGVQHAVIKDMLDRFAHDLAEAQRAAVRDPGFLVRVDDPSDLAQIVHAAVFKAADLIDPQVP